MEQNKINAIIIAGLLVVGAGAWAGPIMTAQTANEFLGDLDNIEELSVALGDDAGLNFDQFGLGDLKDQIFLGVNTQFIAPPPAFGGPIFDLVAFRQQLIPPDVVGEQLTVGADPNVFGTPVTLVEYQACATPENLVGTGSGPALIKDCQPAIIDKLFVMSPANQVNKKYRIQLALCNAPQATLTVADVDNNPNNDLCGGAGAAAFDNAVIVMDTIFQLFGDHTENIILDVGAINPGVGNVLMARAADSVGGAQTVNVWVGIKRVGSEGAVEFINPAQFGGAVPQACIEFTILNNTPGNPAIQGATVDLKIQGPPNTPPFSDVKLTDANGKARFEPVPNGFAVVDLFIPTKPTFFLDRPVLFPASAPGVPPNSGPDVANCNETLFTLPPGV